MERTTKIDCVVKVGGKLCSSPKVITQVMNYLTEYRELGRFFVVLGGGVFADKVRELYNAKELTEDSAHWMAIKATEMTSLLVANTFQNLHPFSKLEEFERTWELGGVPTFFPFEYLRTNDELPHSWKVTSDSIAYWVGMKVRARAVFLVKDVDGIHEGNPGGDFRSTPVYKTLTPRKLREVQASWGIPEGTAKYFAIDPYLPELVETADYDLPCVVVAYWNLHQVPRIIAGGGGVATIIRKRQPGD